jgi:hypothetical protein
LGPPSKMKSLSKFGGIFYLFNFVVEHNRQKWH